MPGTRDKPALLAQGIPTRHKPLLFAKHWSLQFGVPLILCSSLAEFRAAKYQAHLAHLVSPGPGAEDATVQHLAPFWDWMMRAGEAVVAGVLPTTDGGAALAAEGAWSEVLVWPGDLVAWFETQHVKVAEDFDATRAVTKRLDVTSARHPALDPTHPFYPVELAHAIRAWEALFLNRAPEKRREPGGFRKLIGRWLDANASGLKRTRADRIAMVVNPNKIGGAPPT